jgi:hypothetical protein
MKAAIIPADNSKPVRFEDIEPADTLSGLVDRQGRCNSQKFWALQRPLEPKRSRGS